MTSEKPMASTPNIARQSSIIEKDKKSILTRMAKCLKPCFKAKIINVDLKHTVWINFGVGKLGLLSAAILDYGGHHQGRHIRYRLL